MAPKHERALEAEIDAAGLLGQALAEADEHEGRRDADRAAEHGDEDGDEAESSFMCGPPLLGWKIVKRP